MPPAMPTPLPNHPNYDFIVNPTKPARKLSLRGINSVPARLALVSGAALGLLILFVVVKSLFGGSVSNAASLTTVVQDQQVLIHISTAATQQTGTNTTTQNSAATILASVGSTQQQLLAYLKANGQSVSQTVANKKAGGVDAQLTAAASAGNYDKTYRTLTQGWLTDYQQALKQAYAQTTGPQGRALLNGEYNSAQLLAQQLAT